MINLLKKTAVAAALCMASTTAVAETYTLDEIFGGSQQITAIESKQYFSGFQSRAYRINPAKANYVGSFGVTMERVPGSETKMKISGVCFDEYYAYDTYSFIFTLSNNGTESADGNQLVIKATETSIEDGETQLRYATLAQEGDWWYGYYYIFQPIDSPVVLNITKNDDGSFSFKTDGKNTVVLYPNPHNFWGSATDVLEFETYETNTIATEVFEDWYLTDSESATGTQGTKIGRTYPVHVTMDYAKNTCTIKNFANQGYMLQASKAQNKSHLTGKINQTDHTITFSETPGYINQGIYADSYSNYDLYNVEYKLCTWDGIVTNSSSDGKGVVTPGAVAKYDERNEVHHNDIEHGWVTNGGKRRTWGSETIWFEDPILFFNKSHRSNRPGNVPYDLGTGFKNWNHMYNMPKSSAVYYDMVIGEDVTLDINLKINNYGVDDKNVYVNATMNELKNYQHVDHYELYIVPGKFNSITDAEFNHHLETGHVNAICASDYANTWTPKNRVADINPDAARPNGGVGEHTFNVVIPASALGGATDKDKGYTVFVKAIYKDKSAYNASTDLTPTFHNLAYVNTTTTGVESITEPEAAKVYAVAGNIVIEGSEAAAEVYAASGALVYSGADRTIAVTPGVYIVRLGDTATKLVVK